MLVYMTHAKHGRMPCYTTQEVEYNKKYGWEVEPVAALFCEKPKQVIGEKRKLGRPKKAENGNRV